MDVCILKLVPSEKLIIIKCLLRLLMKHALCCDFDNPYGMRSGINWMAQIIRMPDDNVVKKVLQFKVIEIRKRGRPRLRWADSWNQTLGL
ncbi:hypothetical protein TNCV_285411 [Trichonephila clavipes]|nr:hypothetical protein TNCV_285411 [Trichonephila clavipes]